MAAVYDEFGNLLYDDPNIPTPMSEPDVDVMRYELAKAGSMPLRPGGSDVPYLASQVPKIRIPKAPPEPARPASTATNVPQAIADRLGLSAIPQAALGMISSFPAAVAKETGFPKVAEAIQYTPTSKMGQEVLEGVSRLPQVVTGSEMGVGPLAEFYVPRRAFGLERRPFLSPDDVRVMGGRAIESGRELRNVPEDFRAAQEGLRRESVFGGPTIGARTQGLFDEIGDVMARREMQGLSPIPGIPDIVSPQTRMYAVRQANVGQMIDPTDLPTAKYGDTPRKVRTVQNIIQDIVPYTESDYPHNTSTEYYNAAVRDAPKPLEDAWRTFSQKKINEMFPDAPNDSAAAEAYGNRFNQKEFALSQINMLSDFASSPEALTAIESVANERDQLINEYNAQKNKPKEKKPVNSDELGAYRERRRAQEELVEQLELNLLQKDLMPELSRKEFIERITPPTKEEYMRRAQAAKDYLEGTFKKDIAKYIGTSQGPQMELAKRGITMAPKEELLEMMKKFESPRGAFRGELDDLSKERAKAGFNPRGEMYPLIVQKETEVKDLQTQLNDLNRQKNELSDLHRIELPDVPDPARNTGPTGAKYRALKNPMNTLIDKIEQNKKQLENFRLANAYETISDVAYTPVLAKEFKKAIPFAEQQFFPGLKDTPDIAQMFNVKSRELGELGIPFLAEMIVKNIMSGRIPLDETKPSALPKSKYKEDLSGFSEEDILDYAKAVKESKAAPRAKEEAEAAVLSGTSNKFIVYEGKRIAGAASYDIDESTKTVFIDHLGSLIKGTGKQMVQEIENAVPPGYRVVLTSSDQAKKFWDKLGYKPTGEGNLLEKRIEDASDQKTSKPKLDIQIDKIIEQLTKPRLKEETIKEAESRKGMVQLNEYAQDTLSKIPPDLHFKNSKVLELTKDSTEDAIRRQISFDGMVLDHCIAGCDAPHPGINPFSGERYNYSYPVDPATGKDRGDRKLASSFMKKVLSGTERTAHLRDNISGLPAVTINMVKDNSGKYVLNYVSGYQNTAKPEDVSNYAADIKDYLNLRADIISGPGDSLSKWGIFDTASVGGRSKTASLLNLNPDAIPNLGLPRFVLENDIREMALQQPMGNTHADMIRRRAQLNDEYNRLSREFGEDDPRVQDIGNDIANLTARLQSTSRQVATQGSPNLFRRMTSEALTNELYRDNTRGPVLAVYDNLINDDTYGLRDFWEDDFDFYPDRLRTFTNAVRNNENLLQAMTTDQEGYEAHMRERLARFQTAIEQFTPQQRELLVRTLDDFAETSLFQQFDNLDQDDRNAGMNEYFAERPQTQDYLEEIARRRRGEDFTPEAAPAQENQLVPEYIRGVITRELNEMMMLGELNRAGSVLNRIFEGDGAFGTLTTDEQRTAASDFFNSTLRGLLNDPDYRPAGGQRATPPDIFAGGIPGAAPEPNGPEAYRDQYTNEEMGSRRAFDQIIQAERMTPGAINEAIRRTDGRAMYDAEVMQFYNVLAPAGISQINNALRRYMEGNGFDVPPRPAPTNQESLSDILDEALQTASYNYPDNIVDVMQRDLDTIMTEGVRFDRNPDEFILRLNELAREAAATGLEGDATYATAMNELASSLLYSYQQLPDTPGNAANPIDELERRYGQAPRAPIDIVTDGLNRPITQFERDYSEEVQNEYREILREIDPAVNTQNLQNAMHHLGIIHDILLSGDHQPEYFNLSSTAEMNRFADLIDRHFEVFRQLENLLDDADREPPEGRKRGGFIERATGVRSYSDLKRDKFNRNFYDDGQAALDFQLRHGVRSDQLGISPKRYPDRSEADIIAPKSDEHLSFRHQELQGDLKRGGRVRRMSNGGVNKVRPTPNIPATPAKQNPNKTDYVPNVPADPGFKETLERVTNKPIHPSVAKGVAEGRIPLSDAQRMSDYAFTQGSPKVGSGSSSMPDQSQKMENYLNRVKVGEVQNPYPTEQRQPISRDLTGRSDFTREQLREQALRDPTLNPRSGGVSGGGGNLTDAELKNRLGSRNPTYNAGGKVSIDQMRYELLRK